MIESKGHAIAKALPNRLRLWQANKQVNHWIGNPSEKGKEI